MMQHFSENANNSVVRAIERYTHALETRFLLVDNSSTYYLRAVDRNNVDKDIFFAYESTPTVSSINWIDEAITNRIFLLHTSATTVPAFVAELARGGIEKIRKEGLMEYLDRADLELFTTKYWEY
jgi:hypothetical protein